MDNYINAIRAAASACEPRELKDALDFILESAREEYQAGALGVTEYGDICNEYADTLTANNVVNYM